MNLKAILSLLLLVLALCSCNETPAPQIEKNEKVFVVEKDYYDYKFKGTLACDNCPGIETEIDFYEDSMNYKERDIYIGGHGASLDGPYTIVKGYKENKNQLVFILDEQKGRGRKFLQVDDSTLLKLDGKGEIISWAQSYQLHQIKK